MHAQQGGSFVTRYAIKPAAAATAQQHEPQGDMIFTFPEVLVLGQCEMICCQENKTAHYQQQKWGRVSCIQ